MAEGKKISELNEVSSVTDNDEFIFVDKEGTGSDSGIGGKTAKISFANLKSAIGPVGQKGEAGEKGDKGDLGPQGSPGEGADSYWSTGSVADTIGYLGRVGIGTTEPAISTNGLHIQGPAHAMIQVEGLAGNSMIGFGPISDLTGSYAIKHDTLGDVNFLRIATVNAMNQGGGMTLTNNDLTVAGKIGIGANSPTAKLEVSSSDAEKNSAIFSNTHANGYGAKFIGGGGGDNEYHYLASFRDYEGNEKLRLQGDGELQIIDKRTAAPSIRFITSEDIPGYPLPGPIIAGKNSDTLVLTATTPTNGFQTSVGGQYVCRINHFYGSDNMPSSPSNSPTNGLGGNAGFMIMSGSRSIAREMTGNDELVDPSQCLLKVQNSGNVNIGRGSADYSDSSLDIQPSFRNLLKGLHAVTEGSQTLTGTDTNYTSVLSAGDEIQLARGSAGADEYFVVDAVVSDTECTLNKLASTTYESTFVRYNPSPFALRTRNNSGYSTVEIDSKGFVGIGTGPIDASPLTIKKVVNKPQLILSAAYSPDQETAGSQGLYQDIELNGHADVVQSHVGRARIRHHFNPWNDANSSISFWTTNHSDEGLTKERVRITSTGLVGINTTTPEATLEVNGTTRTGHMLYTEQNGSGYVTNQTISVDVPQATEGRVYHVVATRHTGQGNSQLRVAYLHYSANGTPFLVDSVGNGGVNLSVSGTTVSVTNGADPAVLKLRILMLG